MPRHLSFNSMLVAMTLSTLLATSAQAVPLTSGGPGGVGTTDGSSNLRLWVRGDKGVSLSGSLVTQWDDQSGYGAHLTPDNAARRPDFTTVQNNIPVVTFNITNPPTPTPPVTQQFLRAAPTFTLGGTGAATTYSAFYMNESSVGSPFFARTPVN